MSFRTGLLSRKGILGFAVVGLMCGFFLSSPVSANGSDGVEGVGVSEGFHDGAVLVTFTSGGGHGDDCSCCCSPRETM